MCSSDLAVFFRLTSAAMRGLRVQLQRDLRDLGEGFIECHHVTPVSELRAGTRTRLSDLAVVCSNCHRMLHRRRPWLTAAELRGLIQ